MLLFSRMLVWQLSKIKKYDEKKTSENAKKTTTHVPHTKKKQRPNHDGNHGTMVPSFASKRKFCNLISRKLLKQNNKKSQRPLSCFLQPFLATDIPEEQSSHLASAHKKGPFFIIFSVNKLRRPTPENPKIV